MIESEPLLASGVKHAERIIEFFFEFINSRYLRAESARQVEDGRKRCSKGIAMGKIDWSHRQKILDIDHLLAQFRTILFEVMLAFMISAKFAVHVAVGLILV